MICYIIQQTWTSAVSDRDCAFSNRQNILLRGFEEAFHLSLQDVKLEKGLHGKPFVKDHPEVFFNLTHTFLHPGDKSSAHPDSLPCNPTFSSERKYYMAGVFASFPVGIDCEYPRSISEKLYNRVLSDSEKTQLKDSPCPEALFRRFWTLKESYVKYTGEGLHCELSSLSFYRDQNGCWLLKDHPDQVFLQYDLANGLIVSLCCDRECPVQFITL